MQASEEFGFEVVCLHLRSGNPVLLLECARRFSPMVEQTSDDAVIFDVEGMGRLYATPRHLAEAIAAQAGIPVSLSIGVQSGCGVSCGARLPRDHGDCAR